MTETLEKPRKLKPETEAPVRLKQMMTDDELLAHVETAVRAADSKKAEHLVVLKLIELTAFTDYFVICSGNSARQVQAISDELELKLKERGMRPLNIEGYNNAEWVLMDYGAFVVHIFTATSRSFYDLERLWRDAEKINIDLSTPVKKPEESGN